MLTAIDIYGGGPGSGCHGSNCGRRLTKLARTFQKGRNCAQGECSFASRELVKHLKKNGISARVVNGYYRKPGGTYVPHSWVRVGDKIIDVTAGQFYKDKQDRLELSDKNDSRYLLKI